MELDALVDHPEGHLGGDDLRYRDLLCRVPVLVEEPRTVVDILPGRLDFAEHVHDLVAGDLEFAEGPAEDLPLLDVLDRLFQDQGGAGHGAYGGHESFALEVDHHLDEPLVLLAQELVLGNPNILERKLRCVRGVHSHLVDLAAHREARKVRVEEEEADSVVPEVRRRLGGEDDHVGPSAVRDKSLRSVDHVVVAVLPRRGLHGRYVGTGVRLGDPQSTDLLPLNDRDEIFLSLLLGADNVDRRGGHVGLHHEGHVHAAALGARQLLAENHLVEVVARGSAHILRVGDAQEAHLPCSFEDPVREVFLLLPLLRMRGQFLLHEGSHGLPKNLVLFLEPRALHVRFPPWLFPGCTGEKTLLVPERIYRKSVSWQADRNRR